MEKVVTVMSLTWDEIKPPPVNIAFNHYITGVIHSSETTVEILDVEKILDELGLFDDDKIVSPIDIAEDLLEVARKFSILVIDDSLTARHLIKKALSSLNINIITATTGRQALDLLEKHIPLTAGDVTRKFIMVICDVEMPEMDGYTFLKKCRESSALKNLYIVLNTSITSVFNEDDLSKTGCNAFIGKINPDMILNQAINQLKQKISKHR